MLRRGRVVGSDRPDLQVVAKALLAEVGAGVVLCFRRKPTPLRTRAYATRSWGGSSVPSEHMTSPTMVGESEVHVVSRATAGTVLVQFSPGDRCLCRRSVVRIDISVEGGALHGHLKLCWSLDLTRNTQTDVGVEVNPAAVLPKCMQCKASRVWNLGGLHHSAVGRRSQIVWEQPKRWVSVADATRVVRRNGKL